MADVLTAEEEGVYKGAAEYLMGMLAQSINPLLPGDMRDDATTVTHLFGPVMALVDRLAAQLAEAEREIMAHQAGQSYELGQVRGAEGARQAVEGLRAQLAEAQAQQSAAFMHTTAQKEKNRAALQQAHAQGRAEGMREAADECHGAQVQRTIKFTHFPPEQQDAARALWNTAVCECADTILALLPGEGEGKGDG